MESIVINFNNVFTEVRTNMAQKITKVNILIATCVAVTFFNQKKEFQYMDSKRHSLPWKQTKVKGITILTFILLWDVLELYLYCCNMFLIFPFNAAFFQTNWKFHTSHQFLKEVLNEIIAITSPYLFDQACQKC